MSRPVPSPFDEGNDGTIGHTILAVAVLDRADRRSGTATPLNDAMFQSLRGDAGAKLRSIVSDVIATSLFGRSCRLRATFEIFSTISCPSTTSPKMVCLPGEPVGIGDRDEELRSVGVRPGVGHREFAGFVEAVRRAFGFVFELVAGAAHAGALRVSTLNHEIGNDAMKNRPVVERSLALRARCWDVSIRGRLRQVRQSWRRFSELPSQIVGKRCCLRWS